MRGFGAGAGPDSGEPGARRSRLFVYGALMDGESEHQLLKGALALGPARTAPDYYLFELGTLAALVEGGTTEVVGELYDLDIRHRSRIDVSKQHPILFYRDRVVLSDGSEAEAYFMRRDQVRARRRLADGDFRRRFEPRQTGIPKSAWAGWARSRASKP